MRIKAIILISSILLIAGACNPVIEPLSEFFLNVTDYEETVPTQLLSGSYVGNIKASSNHPALMYTILNQDPTGAISVSENSGVIYVEDEVSFDHKQNTEITAEIEVEAGELRERAHLIIHIDELNTYDYEIIDYFKDIALGFEFGGASEITRRWQENMKIYVAGAMSKENSDELHKIIDELNSLVTTNFHIDIVDTQVESNYFLFFGDHLSYNQLFPSLASQTASNWGLFNIWWNGSNQLIGGRMYIDTDRANQIEQLHLLREELTQSLGLGKDSNKYTNSIFQSSFSTKVTEYSILDKELIRLLYHPKMSVNLSGAQVEVALRNILISEK